MENKFFCAVTLYLTHPGHWSEQVLKERNNMEVI